MFHAASRLVWPMLLLLGAAANTAAQGNSDSAEQYYQRGKTALAAGNYQEAQRAYEKLRDLEPGIAEVHANLGVIYFQERQFEQAVASLRRALSLKSGMNAATTLLAVSLAELGRYNEALPELEKTFRGSHEPDAKRMCGLQLIRAYDNLQRESEAVEVALRLNRLFPNDPEILYQTGRVYGNYAFVTMRKLAQAAPNSIWRHQAAAEAYESQGSTDQAVAEYGAVLAQDPGRPGVHYRIGRTLLSRARHGGSEEDTQAAFREFERELEVDSTNANAAYEVGEIYRRAGQFDKAREQFEKAIKYYPDFQQAQLALGGTLLSLDLAEHALPHLKKAATLDPNDDVPYYRLARAYRVLGNAPEATQALAEFQRLHDRREAQGDSQQKFEAVDVTKQTADQRNP